MCNCLAPVKAMLKRLAPYMLFFAFSTALALPGARSAQVGNEVFLGGDFIEVGISGWGSFGTEGPKPAGFYGAGSRSNIGMSADFDGFGEGQDIRIDYFLPGNPEERWAVGYKIGGTPSIASNCALNNSKQITVTVTDTSAGDILSALVEGTMNSKLQIQQNIQFAVGQKFFKNTVVFTNVSADTLDNVRFMRTFDPDNTRDYGGTADTYNEVLNQYADDGYSAVMGRAKSETDPVFIDTGSLSPIVFFTDDPRAKVSIFGFTNTDVYAADAYDSAKAKGYNVIADQAITVTVDVGTIPPGQAQTFIYYTSLDDRDFADVLKDIQADLSSNKAPALDTAATPLFTSIVKNNTTNNGNSIEEVIVDGSITDADGPVAEAIAVIGVDNSNGTWQFSTDDGSTWTDLGTPTESAARLLDSSHRVRFVPTSEWTGSASITFKAWDKSSGEAGSVTDTTNGIRSAFSSDSDTASITVTETLTNNAPVLNTVATPLLSSILVNNTTNSGNSVGEIVVDGSITDPDGPASESVAVTAVDNTNGVWQYSTDGGTTWTALAPVDAATARLLEKITESDSSRMRPGTELQQLLFMPGTRVPETREKPPMHQHPAGIPHFHPHRIRQRSPLFLQTTRRFLI